MTLVDVTKQDGMEPVPRTKLNSHRHTALPIESAGNNDCLVITRKMIVRQRDVAELK